MTKRGRRDSALCNIQQRDLFTGMPAGPRTSSRSGDLRALARARLEERAHPRPKNPDQDHDHDHDHDHPGTAKDEGAPSYYAILEISLRELLIEAGLITADGAHHHQIEILDSRSPASQFAALSAPFRFLCKSFV